MADEERNVVALHQGQWVTTIPGTYHVPSIGLVTPTLAPEDVKVFECHFCHNPMYRKPWPGKKHSGFWHYPGFAHEHIAVEKIEVTGESPWHRALKAEAIAAHVRTRRWHATGEVRTSDMKRRTDVLATPLRTGRKGLIDYVPTAFEIQHYSLSTTEGIERTSDIVGAGLAKLVVWYGDHQLFPDDTRGLLFVHEDEDARVHRTVTRCDPDPQDRETGVFDRDEWWEMKAKGQLVSQPDLGGIILLDAYNEYRARADTMKPRRALKQRPDSSYTQRACAKPPTAEPSGWHPGRWLCELCNDTFNDRRMIEAHVTQLHQWFKVTRAGWPIIEVEQRKSA